MGVRVVIQVVVSVVVLVGVVEVFCNVRMGVGVGSVGDRGEEVW